MTDFLEKRVWRTMFAAFRCHLTLFHRSYNLLIKWRVFSQKSLLNVRLLRSYGLNYDSPLHNVNCIPEQWLWKKVLIRSVLKPGISTQSYDGFDEQHVNVFRGVCRLERYWAIRNERDCKRPIEEWQKAMWVLWWSHPTRKMPPRYLGGKQSSMPFGLRLGYK
jgi:hypothetical protein